MSGRLDSNQRPPEPHLGGLIRFLPQIPVDSPPYSIIRIAPIAEKATFPTFFCCKLLQVPSSDFFDFFSPTP